MDSVSQWPSASMATYWASVWHFDFWGICHLDIVLLLLLLLLLPSPKLPWIACFTSEQKGRQVGVSFIVSQSLQNEASSTRAELRSSLRNRISTVVAQVMRVRWVSLGGTGVLSEGYDPKFVHVASHASLSSSALYLPGHSKASQNFGMVTMRPRSKSRFNEPPLPFDILCLIIIPRSSIHQSLSSLERTHMDQQSLSVFWFILCSLLFYSNFSIAVLTSIMNL